MKFSFITLDFKRMPLEFCFECGSYYGFDGVEIFCSRNHLYPEDTTSEYINQVKTWKKKYKLEIPMIVPACLGTNCGLASLIEPERVVALQRIKEHIDIAEKLESPRVLITPDHPGYGQEKEAYWSAFVNSVQELVDYADGTGVHITVEPLTRMESPVICSTDDCVKLIKDSGKENLHFMMDIVPPTMEFEPFSDYFTKLDGKMDYIHICNTDGMSDAHNRLEQGIIPIEDMFTVFQHWRYEGYVSTELYSEGYRDPELLLAGSARVLRNVCEKLNIQTGIGRINRGL